jgi:hypothetical protein
MKKLYVASICFLVIGLYGCSSEEEISKEFILETNSKIENQEGLKFLGSELSAINSFIETDFNDNKSLVLNNTDLKLFNSFKSSFTGIESRTVSLKAEVSILFDPEKTQCALPKKVARKLKKLRDEGKSWAPSFVVNFMKELPDSATFLPRTSVSVLLHTVEIKSNDGSTRTWTTFDSPTFNNLSIDKFILKEGFDSFIYSLDCSGYLNAAIEGAATVPGADIKASAKSALDKQNSMFIGGGVLVSPLATAFYGSTIGVDLDTAARLGVLKSIISMPLVQDTDSIIFSNSYEAIWASNDGTASFNGEAQFQGNAGGGVGVVQVSANAGGGGSISRESSYNTFKTYFTSRKVISDLRPFTIAQVKSMITTLEDGSDIGL